MTVKPNVQNQLYMPNAGECEHSVSTCLDYPFATEFYNSDDFRYKFVQEYKKLIKDAKGIDVFNCKIQTPTISPDILNVYIYVHDRSAVMGKEYRKLFPDSLGWLDLFYLALETVPLKEITDKTVRIFIEDFPLCSKAYSANESLSVLNKSVPIKFKDCISISISNTTIYIFLTDDSAIENLIVEKMAEPLKQMCYNAVKACDIDNVWSYEDFHIRIDTYDHYKKHGIFNYFNSDEMTNNTLL